MLRIDRVAPFVLPFLAALLLFVPTIASDLTADDSHHVSPPPMDETTTWSQVWSEPTFYYHPVVLSVFWVEGKLGHLQGAQHGLNVVLHGAVTLLVVRLALSLGLGPWAAAAAGLLFAVHLVHAEAVVLLFGRADLMAALWVLLALWLHDRVITEKAPGSRRLPREARRSLAFLGALCLAFLAAGSKESAVLLPLFGAALHGVRRRSLKTAWPMWMGYALGLGAFLVLRRDAMGFWFRFPETPETMLGYRMASPSGADLFLVGLRVLGRYACRLVFPLEPARDYWGGVPGSFHGGDVWSLWAGAALIAASLLGIVWGAIHAERVRGRVALISGILLVSSAFVVVDLACAFGGILGDAPLYLPSVGWVLLVVTAGMSLWEKVVSALSPAAGPD